MAASAWTAAQMPSQAGKTILITGANSGIGYQAAVEFARHGARVLLGCRSEAKGREALGRLQREVPGAQAELSLLDMASLDAIRTFATGFNATETTLDVLVNNAGVMALPAREVTADGWERQFGTNHLGHFALTGLLLPALRRSAAPRVVTVASLAHRGGKIDFDDLQAERSYRPWDAYNNSKLANLLFTVELDRRAKAAGLPLLSVAVHPGVSRTSIFQNGPGKSDLKSKVMHLVAPVLMQDDSMGALPTEYAVTVANVQGGSYIGPNGFGEFKGYPTVVKPRQVLEPAVARRLWEASEQLTGVRYL